MKSRVKTALGIDIGEHRVSVALVEKDARGWKVVASADAELPGENPGQGGAGQVKVLSHVLRRLGRRAAVRRAKAAVAVSAGPMVMQLLDVPGPVPPNIGEFVRQELRQYVLLSGRDVLSDFCGIGAPAGPRKRLLAVGVDRTLVTRMARVCMAAGVDITAAEPSVLACARGLLAVEKQARYNHTVLIGMLGARDLAMCLFRKGVLDFVRVRAIPPEAGTITAMGTWLTEELRTVMRYCDTAAARDGVQWQVKVVVRNGTYTAGNLAPLVIAEADMSTVAVVDPGLNREGQVSSPDSPSNETASMVAVGAALKLLDAEADEFGISLVPDEVRQARRLSRHVLAAANAAALVIIGMLLAGQLLARATGAMHQRIEQTRVSRQLHTAPALIAQERALDREIDGIEQQLKHLTVVRTEPAPDWSAVLHAVGQATTPDMRITHLASSDNRNLTVNGLVQSTEAVEAFVRNLDGREPFAAVRLARIQRKEDRSGLIEYQVNGLLKVSE